MTSSNDVTNTMMISSLADNGQAYVEGGSLMRLGNKIIGDVCQLQLYWSISKTFISVQLHN